MILSILTSFFPYSLITAYTPGPNNVLSINTTTTYGLKNSFKTLLGISLGFICVMILSAVFTFQLASHIPSFIHIMKYVGAIYILGLAIHIALSKPASIETKKKPSFVEGFLLQFVNVKIILYAITIYTGYVMPVNNELSILIIFALIISVIGISGTLTWAFLGSIFQKFINRHFRIFNLLMGLILLNCAIKMLFIK